MKKYFLSAVIGLISVVGVSVLGVEASNASAPRTDIKNLINLIYGADFLNRRITAKPASNQGMVLFRITRDCETGKPVGQYYSSKTEFKSYQWITGNLQMIDLQRDRKSVV